MRVDQDWQNAKNILCVRLDSLGDVLMCTPAVRALKESQPDRNIKLLTSQAGAAIAPLIPAVDETIIYDPPWMKATTPPSNSEREFEMIDRLKQCAFDAAVIFTTFSQSPLPAALMTFMADIPLRLAHCRENPYYLLTHWVQETDNFGDANIRHEVRRQLDLVASIGARTTNENLSLRVSTEAMEKASKLLVATGLNVSEPWLIIHPGATAASRRYPPEHFAEAANKLTSFYGFQILFTGTASEVELVDNIRSRMNKESFSLVNKLNIEEFASLIYLAPLIISNNTGPVHVAAALSTPVVDLYALTNPQHTPWQVPQRVLYHDVPCKYCHKSICPLGHHNCLRMVSPELVVAAALDLLREIEISPGKIKRVEQSL